jgi:hypothetical protein
MAEATNPATQECSTCGTLIDVTEEQPLALRHCPHCGGAMRVRRIFNHFELQEVLGAGGVGAVYRALDTNLNRAVALKLLRSEHSQNPELIESFSKEAAITASISHPHVVKVYSTGTDHGIFYIAMELVDKGSLDDLMSLQGKVGESQVLEVGIQIAQGLQAAYQSGLIHRDVKPGNILFADAHNAKIVDFGLAVLQEHANTGGGPVWGTPYYVAPEKLEPEPREDFRSDMYSLGATLFHAAAGRPPFEAETASMITLKHLKSQVVSIQAFAPEISSTTAYIINKTLHKDPAERYASYEELIENLQYARNELLGAAAAKLKRRAVKDEPSGWWTFAGMAVVVAAGLSLYQFRDRIFGPPPRQETPSAEQAAVATFDAQLQKARGQIADGQSAEAAAALRTLDASGVAPQPLRNWINMNAGLAFLLAGQPEEAQKEFKKVEDRGIYSPDPSEQKIASFFVNTTQLAAGEAPHPAAVAKDYDQTNHEAFALLLFGVKDWSLGAFDDAGALFEHFQSAMPGETDAWLNAYKPISTSYLADLAAYRTAAESAGRAMDLDALQQALDAAKAAREKLKQRGKLADKLAEVETDLSKKLAAAQEAKTMKDAEQEAADAKVVATAIARVTSLYAELKFNDARQTLAAAAVTSEKARTEHDAWATRTEWLARFKATLVSDINTVGFAQPLVRKNHTAIPFGLRKATDATTEMVTPYGNVPVAWTEISIESLTLMAQTFLRAAPPTVMADRQWQLGVFLYAFGKKAEGLVMLHQSAEAKPEYQPFLTLFPES